MKIFVSICLFTCASIIILALYIWVNPSEIRHYTADDLVGLTCAELGEKHEEVIFAYHDAAIDHRKRTGAFPDDLGLPQDDVLPFAILLRTFIQENDLSEFDLSQSFFHSSSRLHSNFFAEASHVCASNPSQGAMEAVGRAAKNLNLID